MIEQSLASEVRGWGRARKVAVAISPLGRHVLFRFDPCYAEWLVDRGTLTFDGKYKKRYVTRVGGWDAVREEIERRWFPSTSISKSKEV